MTTCSDFSIGHCFGSKKWRWPVHWTNKKSSRSVVLLSMSQIPSDGILESLYKLRIRGSAQLKTVLELYDMEIHQKISVPNDQKLKTMVKRRKKGSETTITKL